MSNITVAFGPTWGWAPESGADQVGCKQLHRALDSSITSLRKGALTALICHETLEVHLVGSNEVKDPGSNDGRQMKDARRHGVRRTLYTGYCSKASEAGIRRT